MAAQSTFFTRERFKTILLSIALELFFMLVLQPAARFLITNNANMTINSLFSVEITVILLLVFAMYISWQLWRWRREDKALVKQHFITLLHDLHLHQSKLVRYVENDNKEQIGREISKINHLLKKLKTHQSKDILPELRAKQELERSA